MAPCISASRHWDNKSTTTPDFLNLSLEAQTQGFYPCIVTSQTEPFCDPPLCGFFFPFSFFLSF